MKKILVINGPNLNLLGRREPGIYGNSSLPQIEERLREVAGEIGLEIEFFQSNHEGELLDQIHGAVDRIDGVLMNPGALTHSSIAIVDALLATGLPAVEVHLSNLARREEFRRKSVTARGVIGSVTGFGARSYEWGLRALAAELDAIN